MPPNRGTNPASHSSHTPHIRMIPGFFGEHVPLFVDMDTRKGFTIGDAPNIDPPIGGHFP